MSESIKHECGIALIRLLKPLEYYQVKYGTWQYGLQKLYLLMEKQHNRGQEGAGIASLVGEKINLFKNKGLVSEVFSPKDISDLGDDEVSIGHVRYSTTGSNSKANTQPILAEYLRGRVAVAHNGNIVNSMEIRKGLEKEGCIFRSTNDSESIAKLIAFEMLTEKDELKANKVA